MFEFKCPSCEFQKSNLDATFEGKHVKCPKCGAAAAVSAVSQPNQVDDFLDLDLDSFVSPTLSPSQPQSSQKEARRNTPVRSERTTKKSWAAVSTSRKRLGDSTRQLSQSLQQNFGAAIFETSSNLGTAASLFLKHPIKILFLSVLFYCSSALALGSVVLSLLFPVLAMGYALAIKGVVTKEPKELDVFLSFLRHGWDSLWHMVMLLTAFVVTLGAMLAPAVIILALFMLLFGTLGALYSDIGEQFPADNTVVASSMPDEAKVEPNEIGVAIGEAMRAVLQFVVNSTLMLILTALATPICAAFILFFFLVIEVAEAKINVESRFNLVINCYRNMLDRAKRRWKTVFVSGLSIASGAALIIAFSLTLAYLLEQIELRETASFLIGDELSGTSGLGLTLTMALFSIFAILFTVVTCLNLREKGQTSPR